MIDCWPGFSDAIVDYYYGKKLAYEYIKCSQSNVLISLGEEDEKGNPVIMVNDLIKPVLCSYVITLFDSTGLKILEYERKDIIIGGNSKVTIGYADFRDIRKEKKANALIACMKVISKDAGTFCNHYLYYERPLDINVYESLYQVFKKNYSM
jgi:beta-mannosidase